MEITEISFYPRHTRITVRFRNHLYSSQVRGLVSHLVTTLPGLPTHRCQNRHDRPFAEEIHDSELGHVFEHVILALLQQRGRYARGQTTWNWQRDPIGTYRITIHTGQRQLLKECLLIAQAIFTNALLGPTIRLRPLDAPDAVPTLALAVGRQPLFATG